MQGSNGHRERDALAWFEAGRQGGQMLAEMRHQRVLLEEISGACKELLTKVSPPAAPTAWTKAKAFLSFFALAWKVFRMVPWGILFGLGALIWHVIKPYALWLVTAFSR